MTDNDETQRKKGIGLVVDEKIKRKWKSFAKNHNLTLTKFIKKAVDFYMENGPEATFSTGFNKFFHTFKESLTNIQGFVQLILENEKDEIKPSVQSKIKEIQNQSEFIEDIINQIIFNKKPTDSKYDILIIEDDRYTLNFLTEFFERKGYKILGVLTGKKGLEELERNNPKIILLDILLPDINGYEVCKKIKSDEKYKNIPLYYITAVPEPVVSQKIEETGANGYFLKPFKFHEFNVLFDHL